MPIMQDCLDFNRFAALVDGCMPDAERRGALLHMQTCRDCREVWLQLEKARPGTPIEHPDPALVSTTPQAQQDPAVPAGTDEADQESSFPLGAWNEPPSIIGQSIAGYLLTKELGHGAMGEVHLAVHERIGQRAAVKVVFSQFSQNPQYVRRFLDEARAASAVRHPGLVKIFTYGRFPDGTAYIMMELLEGESLRDRLIRLKRAQERLPVESALRFGKQIASALCAVHLHKIVHRDLKPANVMVVPDSDVPGGERVKVLDFGIAKLTRLDHASLKEQPGAAICRTGDRVFVGTIAYASPEQCQSATAVDGKADVYSLGVMLYEMLAGRRPFEGTLQSVVYQHLTADPDPLQREAPHVPAWAVALVHQMLAKDPSARPTMEEVQQRITTMLIPGAARRQRTWLWVVAAVCLVLVALAAGWLKWIGCSHRPPHVSGR